LTSTLLEEAECAGLDAPATPEAGQRRKKENNPMPAKRSSPTQIGKSPVYRVDIFNVPIQARRRFLDRVEETHRVLRTIPGFIEDHILERPSGPGACTIVTIAIWKDEETVSQARVAVGDWHVRTGFNPQKLMKELGVEAAIGEFHPVELAMTV
jgi:hypothetical protein